MLPARRIDCNGRAHVEYRAIFAFALPMMMSNAVQITLGLIDVWFVGRISAVAVAAVAAVQCFVVVAVSVLGCAAFTSQPLVAQLYGAGRYARAASATWTAFWAALFTAPVFFAIAESGRFFLAPFSLDGHTEKLALEFWFPRMAGSVLGAAGSAILGYFTGIGRPRIVVLIITAVALVNAALNEVFIIHLSWGVAGSGWATTVAQGAGLLLAMAAFLRRDCRDLFKSHLTWIPNIRRVGYQFRFGLPMGLTTAIDYLGFAIFVMMQVRLGPISGAASQIASVLASLAYIPGLGIASTGTTFVGQSLGVGNRSWAMFVGTRVIILTALFTGAIGGVLALSGPFLLPLFVSPQDAHAGAVVNLGAYLLWFAAGYHFFDGLLVGSVMCLRGAGDATVPAILTLSMCWLLFLPLAHSLTFHPGQGWFDFLPQFGWGAVGGWIALLAYETITGTLLFFRWYSSAWAKSTRRIQASRC